jgi:hypothetical protein
LPPRRSSALSWATSAVPARAVDCVPSSRWFRGSLGSPRRFSRFQCRSTRGRRARTGALAPAIRREAVPAAFPRARSRSWMCLRSGPVRAGPISANRRCVQKRRAVCGPPGAILIPVRSVRRLPCGMPPVREIRASTGAKFSHGRSGLRGRRSRSNGSGLEGANSIVRIRASDPSGAPPLPVVRPSPCRNRKSAVLGGTTGFVRGSNANGLSRWRDSIASVLRFVSHLGSSARRRPSSSQGLFLAWKRLGRSAPSASRRARRFSLVPVVISRGRRRSVPVRDRLVDARVEAIRSVVGRDVPVPRKSADTKAPEPLGSGASFSILGLRASDYLSSRAIRLDVSQRLPPIFSTSA